jgi:Mitochondrial carrier protein
LTFIFIFIFIFIFAISSPLCSFHLYIPQFLSSRSLFPSSLNLSSSLSPSPLFIHLLSIRPLLPSLLSPAGILAGLASGFFNHPLDTIKLRIQTESDEADSGLDSRDRDRAPYCELLSDDNSSKSNEYDKKYDKVYEKEYEEGYRGGKGSKTPPVSHNLISMGLLIVKKDGLTALFSGIAASMYSTIFSSAFFCIIYEMIKRQSTIQQ